MKPLAIFDSEVFSTYYLAAFFYPETGEVEHREMFDGVPFGRERIREILATHTVVSFNGNHFDLPLLGIALQERSTTKQIKGACDKIIVGGLKSWDIARQYGTEAPACDHIDLIEVAPGFNGLKIYAGRMHTTRMQDLPLAPDAEVEDGDRAMIKAYCANDLRVTHELYQALLPQIRLRETLGEQYGLDLRSKSDAQIAEAVIVKQVCQRRKERKIARPRIKVGTEYQYKVPAWISFQRPDLRSLLADIAAAPFAVGAGGGITMPPALADRNITIGTSTYRMGIGGLHSTEKSVAHVADDNTLLLDRDVASYYPSIILRLGLYPEQMGQDFLEVYRGIVERRLAAKHAGDKVTADAMKIMVNGTFGKLGSMYSDLYSPDLMIQVTVTGQLALLMLIESLEDAGIPVVSANTDGVVIKCPAARLDDAEFLIFEWEMVTGFDTEEVRYAALYSKDVNNYFALKVGGGAKIKGIYAKGGLSKNPTFAVIDEAVLAHLTVGRSIKSYISGCRDITRFCTIRQVKGGAVDQDGEYLGKAVRWYRSAFVTGPLRYVTNGNAVAESDAGRACMNLPDTFPDDIDYDWYIAQAEKTLRDIGAMVIEEATV